MNSLDFYGWNNYIKKTGNKNTDDQLIARVVSNHGSRYYLRTREGELEAQLTGKLMFSMTRELQPVAGDWVQYINFETQAFITDLLPRTSTLWRQSPGKESDKQVIAANVDTAAIVQGLDQNYNLMRLERYIVQIIACGIKPVLILNKSDLITDKEHYLGEIKRLQRDIRVFFCSTLSGEGIEYLKEDLFIPGSTFVLVGSSGVGKSSIMNAVLKEKLQRTMVVSDATGKGMHTTTTRHLFMADNGCMIIDTPGMREFGIGFSDGYDQQQAFPVIFELAENCRFKDCSHTGEKGCAVIKALEKGEIDEVVYYSYIKLMREQSHFEKSTAEKNREGKRFGKMAREAQDYRKRYKY